MNEFERYLWDQYATAALEALVAQTRPTVENGRYRHEEAAREAFRYANAMIIIRREWTR